MKAVSRWRVFGREAVLLACIAAVPAFATAMFHPRKPAWSGRSPGQIALADALRLQPPPLWVDARSAEAFSAGHVTGAINVSQEDWEGGLAALAAVWTPGRPVVVYCNASSCDSSRVVAERLRRDLGTGQVFILLGGWSTAEKAGR